MASQWTGCLLILYIVLPSVVITQSNEHVDSQEDFLAPDTYDVAFDDIPNNNHFNSKEEFIDLDFPHLIPKTLPCPQADDIWPCECTPINNATMDINCSNVTSEAQLKTIFSREFPFQNFRNFIVSKNLHINALRRGDLGPCSFVKIDIRDSALITIEDLALAESQNTLRELILINNNLRTIPDISYFKQLITLDFEYNALAEFPVLNSSTLRTLNLRGYPFGLIPADALANLPELETADFAYCFLTEILTGTFTHNEKLSYVELGTNSLKSIPNDVFYMNGTNNTLVLQYNHINSVHPEAFSGITGTLRMNTNSLQELQEEVWRPLLEDNVMLYLERNSFTCGCDIAWLILNPTLLGRVHDEATCRSGQKFIELDPAWYMNMC